MPRKKKANDLSAALAPIFAAAEREIVTAVEAYITDRFADLQSALEALNLEAPKPARRGRKPAVAKATRPAAPPKRRKRARAADVMKAVQGALADQKAAVGIGVLREATGYTNAQIRRALGELIKSGAVGKTGQRRDTVYRLAGKKAAPAKPKKPAKRKKTAAKRKKATARKKA